MTGQAVAKIELLRIAADAGKTQQEAASAAGVGVGYASVLAKQNGIIFIKPSDRRLSLIRKLAADGLSVSETAERLGVHQKTVYAAANQHGIEFERKYSVSADVRFSQLVRAVEFAKLYREGKTLEQIGAQFGVTRERVRQVMTKEIGIRSKDGGKHKRAVTNRREAAKRRDARSLKKWGCRWSEYVALRKMKHPTLRYASQRQNAKKRGIGWELTLWQWWKIWEHSGHWAERGQGRRYHMCRLNDEGPYAVDNVYIATGVENMKDYWAKERANPSRSNRVPVLTYEERREKWQAYNRTAYYRRKAARAASSEVAV